MENLKNNTQLPQTAVSSSKLSLIQEIIFNHLKENKGKSITAESLDRIYHFGVRRIKYNLTKLKKKDIGIEEESRCIKYTNGCSVYSVGFYYL